MAQAPHTFSTEFLMPVTSPRRMIIARRVPEQHVTAGAIIRTKRYTTDCLRFFEACAVPGIIRLQYCPRQPPDTSQTAIVGCTKLLKGPMSTDVDRQVLLRTKFHRPRVLADLIHRPHLQEQLNGGWDRPLILLAAPAGFGKSTLLSAWLEACGYPSTWLSLDESDNDLGVFVSYFLGAVRAIFPNALTATRALLSGTNLPPVTVIARSLLNELDESERDFFLVLDDYHVISEQSVHDLLCALLQHPPKRMHLVITTRQDPPLPLRLLRARAQVTEIRGQDLRFSTPEIAQFMEQTLGAPLTDEAIAVLAEKTEGWAAGLRLATLTLRYSGEIDAQIARLHAENRYVMDYLISEVLAHVPPAIQSFLLKTAILDRLCGPLCLEALGPDSAECQPQTCLEWLEQSGMFITALGTQGQWYRYHNLFQELLRTRLVQQCTADEIAALHLRAGAWFARNGFIEEALHHALAGQDTVAAVRLVAQHRHALLNTEQRPRLERWLHMFPSMTVAQHPDLLLVQAWLAEFGRTTPQTVLEMADQAQALVDRMAGQAEQARALRGEIDALRALEMTFAANDAPGVIALATHALEAMPLEWHMARSETWLQLAAAHLMAGQLDRAHAVMAAAERESAAGRGTPHARVVASSCFIHWLAADLPGVLQAAQRTVSISQATGLRETLGWAHYFLACAHYLQNNLAAAELHADAVQEQRYASHPYAVIHTAFVLTLTYQARGRPGEARQMLDRLNDFLEEVHSERLQPLVQAFGAELAAMQGGLVTAGRWATTVGTMVPFGVMAFFHAPQLTVPKILLGMNTPASRQQAAEALARLHDFVTTTHNTRFTIEVLALQALLQDVQGDERASLALLKQAVLMAEPGGFIRIFVDLGPRMAGLLARLRRTGVAPSFTDQILRVFDESTPAAPIQRTAVSNPEPIELIEPLTDREREVLALLAQRLSNKEIAQTLVISSPTVKRHATNIYQKLQAHGRREAVAKATRLGLV
jgi:LuxR family transcriptional regulator, maltose regulon positive regulatory protein